MNRKNTPENFYSKVDKNGPNGCWSWLGSTNRLGYGQLGYQNRRTTAHRLSYELNKGPIPEGQMVRHTCDNPNCCNPDHLLLGTHQDNMNDKKERGRQGGPAGTPSLNPIFKTVAERELEQYGACEGGHTLRPDNQYTKLNGDVVCLVCYYTKRAGVYEEPLLDAEAALVNNVAALIKSGLESIPQDYRSRAMQKVFILVQRVMNEQFSKRT